MDVDFASMIKDLENTGFYDVLLPFLLIFTIIYAILEKVRLFGNASQSRNINIVVAVSIAFFVIRVESIIATINMFLPKVSLLVLVLLMVLLVLGIFGMQAEGLTGGWFFVAMGLAVVGLIWAITSSLPGMSLALPSWLSLDAGNKAILAAVGIFILLLFAFKEKTNNSINWRNEFGSGKIGRRPPQAGE